MNSIVFRTHADTATGIGHLVRCVNLARELALYGKKSIFVLDYPEDSVQPFLRNFEVFFLYEGKQEPLEETEDAEGFVDLLEDHSLSDSPWIVVDDYRLGSKWETCVRGHGYCLAVLDDLLRKHYCDLLIDCRWRGEKTMHLYDSLVPVDSQKLLGPSYTIMYPEYKSHCELKKKKDCHDPFVVMLGFGGGGGKYRLIVELIKCIVGNALALERPILIYMIVGPLYGNGAELERYCNSQDNVTPIVGQTNLYNFLCETDLYIGAAGGIMYQLIMHRIPAVTFSISENQDSDISILEDIGHFFHCDALLFDYLPVLAELVFVVAEEYGRIRELFNGARVQIDGRGTTRIVQAMLHGESEIPCLITDKGTIALEEKKLSQQHSVRRVNDRDINHYLMSRNLKENRRNMTEEEEIPSLHHYLWWFKHNKRASYVILRDETPRIFIWHQLIQRKGTDVLVGGWFVCADDISFAESLLALQWQLKQCDSLFPEVPWIAVISRKNKFVKLLNEYLGFSELSPDHPYTAILSDLFKKATRDTFYYVMR